MSPTYALLPRLASRARRCTILQNGGAARRTARTTGTRWRAAAWLLGAAAGPLGACAGDHDLLAEKKRDASVSADVVMNDARDEADRSRPSSDAPLLPDGPRDGDADAAEREPPEPPVRFSLTWTNGLADSPSARFCLVPGVGDEERRIQAVLVGPLSFGKSAVLADLAGIDRETMDIHPYAVVGELARTADGGFDCAASLQAWDGAVDDGGERRGVVALPAIPARTFTEGRSYLAVATGCTLAWPFSETDGGDGGGDATNSGDGGDAEGGGGSAVDANGDGSAAAGDASVDAATDSPDARTLWDADAMDDANADAATDAAIDVFRAPRRAQVCGSPGTSAGLVLVRMSNRSVGASFGFQIVHASVAIAAARVSLERPGGNAPIFVAEVGPSQVTPRDGLIAASRDVFGSTLGSASVTVGSPSSAFPSTPTSLSSALGASDIDETSLALGDRLTLVVVGAEPGVAAGAAWNGSRIAVVRNAPFAGGD